MPLEKLSFPGSRRAFSDRKYNLDFYNLVLNLFFFFVLTVSGDIQIHLTVKTDNMNKTRKTQRRKTKHGAVTLHGVCSALSCELCHPLPHLGPLVIPEHLLV